MDGMTKISDMFWRLEIPYKDIFTTAYVLKVRKARSSLTW